MVAVVVEKVKRFDTDPVAEFLQMLLLLNESKSGGNNLSFVCIFYVSLC